jgi:hypothetical protein
MRPFERRVDEGSPQTDPECQDEFWIDPAQRGEGGARRAYAVNYSEAVDFVNTRP